MDRAAVNSLMKEASSGDGHAYAALASIVQDELFRFAIAQGLEHENAADATQEVLMRAYARRSTRKPGSDALAWLCGIALNVVRETKRKELRKKRSWMGWNEQQMPRTTDSDMENRPDADELGQLMEAVGELPPRQREAIACRYLRRMTVRETAEVMGCAEGTVKSAVLAALERLRDKLQPAEASDQILATTHVPIFGPERRETSNGSPRANGYGRASRAARSWQPGLCVASGGVRLCFLPSRPRSVEEIRHR